MKNRKSKGIILYDGGCALCRRSVAFIHNHTKKETFCYVKFRTETASWYLRSIGFSEDYFESVVLIEQKAHFVGADAVIRIFRKMKKPWSLLYYLKIFPRSFRNHVYGLISKYRHRKWIQKLLK